MDFVFEQIRTGGDRNFAYLVGDRPAKTGVLIDPSNNPQAVVERAKAQGLTVEYVINTHGHPDHTNGNSDAVKLTGARVAAFKGSTVEPDRALEDGETLRVGDLSLKFFHVPGHCADHLLIFLEEQQVALTGDLLFVGKVGGTSTESAAREEYESLQRTLKILPDTMTVWPGHDYRCRPSSTIALEKATNPFLRVDSFNEFAALKRDWPTFKKTNGLK